MRRGTVERWVMCHLLNRHWVKFGTVPYCVRCGRPGR